MNNQTRIEHENRQRLLRSAPRPMKAPGPRTNTIVAKWHHLHEGNPYPMHCELCAEARGLRKPGGE